MNFAYYEKSIPTPIEEYYRVPIDVEKVFLVKVFKALGMLENEASIAASVLVTADLMGIESHGIQRLKRYYYTPIKKGIISTKSSIDIIREGVAYALIDGHDGLGLVVGYKAMQIAIEKARISGIGFVSVRNSSHFGIAGFYVMQALEHGMIGIAMTNTRPLVSYTHTIGRNIGTNAIAIAIPSKTPPPILIDMAISVVPRGKIEVALRRGSEVPLGWGIDRDGELTKDPAKILYEGSLLPLGGLGEELGGHKGSCLTIAIDILTGVLSDSGWGPYVGSPQGDKPPRVSHTFIAIDVSKFTDLEAFLDRVERYKRYLRNLPKHPKSHRVWIPGEKAWLTMETRRKIGIPIHRSVISELKEIAEDLGISEDYEMFKQSLVPASSVKC